MPDGSIILIEALGDFMEVPGSLLQARMIRITRDLQGQNKADFMEFRYESRNETGKFQYHNIIPWPG
jgi:hypothetical protein